MHTLLCFGDSNTHGAVPMTRLGERKRHPFGQRWPDVAQAALGDGWRVLDAGQPGRTTVHPDPIEGAHRCGRAALLATLECHRPLDLLALMLGTNDLKARFSAQPIDIALGCARLIEDAQASGCGPEGGAPRILLVCPVPIQETGCLGELFAGGAEKSRALAARYAGIAKSLGCGFLDAGALAQVSPVDGVHLDPPGHGAIGRAIADAARALLD